MILARFVSPDGELGMQQDVDDTSNPSDKRVD
jgi:hypothetical protein